VYRSREHCPASSSSSNYTITQVPRALPGRVRPDPAAVWHRAGGLPPLHAGERERTACLQSPPALAPTPAACAAHRAL
jgi:hypothetical protein